MQVKYGKKIETEAHSMRFATISRGPTKNWELRPICLQTSIPRINGIIRQSGLYILANCMAVGSYPLLEAARGGKVISPLELLTNLKVFCCVFYAIDREFFIFYLNTLIIRAL